MTSINLYQEKQEEKKISAATSNGGFFFSLAILILTLLAFAGVKIAVSVLSGRNQAMLANIKQENDSMAGEDSLYKIIDLQSRIDLIKNNLQIKNSNVQRLRMDDLLNHLGSDMSSAIVVTKFKFIDGSKNATDSANSSVNNNGTAGTSSSNSSPIADVTFSANSFDDASKQILNFKKSKYFTNVNVVGIARTDKGINCELTMNIANSN